MRGLGLVIACAAILLSASPARATVPTEVRFSDCATTVGHVLQVPAGVPLLYRAAGWIARTPGLVREYVHGSTVTFIDDGAAVDNTRSFWSDPEPIKSPYGDAWVAWWRYPTSVNVGERRVLVYSAETDHPLVDLEFFQQPGPAVPISDAFVGNPGDGRPWLAPTGFSGAHNRTCTLVGQ